MISSADATPGEGHIAGLGKRIMMAAILEEAHMQALRSVIAANAHHLFFVALLVGAIACVAAYALAPRRYTARVSFVVLPFEPTLDQRNGAARRVGDDRPDFVMRQERLFALDGFRLLILNSPSFHGTAG